MFAWVARPARTSSSRRTQISQDLGKGRTAPFDASQLHSAGKRRAAEERVSSERRSLGAWLLLVLLTNGLAPSRACRLKRSTGGWSSRRMPRTTCVPGGPTGIDAAGAAAAGAAGRPGGARGHRRRPAGPRSGQASWRRLYLLPAGIRLPAVPGRPRDAPATVLSSSPRR